MKSKEEVKNILLEMHQKGITITKKYLKESFKEYGLSSAAIVKHYKNLNNAKRELNIPITMNRSNKEEVIQKINYIYNKYGYFSKCLLESLSIKEEPMVVNHKTIVRIWGSFNNMYNELTNIPRSESGIVKTESQLLNELRRINDKYGYVNSWLLSEFGKYSYDPYILRWKSFEEACKVAEVNYNPYDRWQAQESILEHCKAQLKEEPKREVTFDWLRNDTTNKNLRVDMFFESYNLAIEYNGKQHYEFPSKFHKTEKEFKEQRNRDTLKYKLLKENNINLIIHKYSDTLNTLQGKLEIIMSDHSGLYHDLYV